MVLAIGRVETQQLASYRIEGLLGQGGMGEVHEAWDLRLERRVALKRVRTRNQSPDIVFRRLRREARALARIHHPAVVQIFDLLETRDGGFIVMEFAEGVTLGATLRSGPLPPTTALGLSRDLLDGLSATHAAGLIHRDLKPANVMVAPVLHPRPGEPAVRARILDFGIARDLRRPTGGGTTREFMGIAGTPTAMSPEQALGREPDERSDVFCVGILLYEMLTGISPFQAPSASRVLDRVCSHQPPPVHARAAAVPKRLSLLVNRLLEKDPERRPRNARQALRELDAIITSLPPDAPSRPPADSRRFRPRAARTPDPRLVAEQPTVLSSPRSTRCFALSPALRLQVSRAATAIGFFLGLLIKTS